MWITWTAYICALFCQHYVLMGFHIQVNLISDMPRILNKAIYYKIMLIRMADCRSWRWLYGLSHCVPGLIYKMYHCILWFLKYNNPAGGHINHIFINCNETSRNLLDLFKSALTTDLLWEPMLWTSDVSHCHLIQLNWMLLLGPLLFLPYSSVPVAQW